jgi:hypothetical protein
MSQVSQQISISFLSFSDPPLIPVKGGTMKPTFFLTNENNMLWRISVSITMTYKEFMYDLQRLHLIDEPNPVLLTNPSIHLLSNDWLNMFVSNGDIVKLSTSLCESMICCPVNEVSALLTEGRRVVGELRIGNQVDDARLVTGGEVIPAEKIIEITVPGESRVFGFLRRLGRDSDMSPSFVWRNLQRVTFTVDTRRIPFGAFRLCSNLVEVVLPPHLEVIGGEVFHGCRNLRQVNEPATLMSIGRQAFEGCESLKVDLTLNVVSLASFAFSYSGLRNVTFGRRLSRVGYGTFLGCSLVEVDLRAPCCRVIDRSAFSSCTSLVRVQLPAALEYIGKEAFRETPMIDVNMSHCERLKHIKWKSFGDEKKLQRMALPDHDVNISRGFVDGNDALLVLDVNESMISFDGNLKSVRFSGLYFVGGTVTATMVFSECASFQWRANRPRRPD